MEAAVMDMAPMGTRHHSALLRCSRKLRLAGGVLRKTEPLVLPGLQAAHLI